MKTFFMSVAMITWFAFSAPAYAKVYYTSPAGSDSDPGTIDKPYASWEKLASVLSAGDTGYIRGGTYRTDKNVANTGFCRITNSGTKANPIKIWAYPGEYPVFNFDNIVSTGTPTVYSIYVGNCNWIYFKGLHTTGLAQNPNGSNYTYGWFFDGGSNITVENCEADHSCEGFAFSNTVNITFLNCDAHHLQDPYSASPYGGSNGFSSTGGQPVTVTAVFKNCRAWWCSDDGFDLFSSDGVYTFDNCWSFWNGYIPGTFKGVGNGDGFKLGPTVNDLSTSVKHILTNCVAFKNLNQGFDQNDGRCINQLTNCTSYANGDIGYHFGYEASLNIQHIFKNNISFQDKNSVSSTSTGVESNNTWNGKKAATTDFESLNNSGVDGIRKADGSLPDLQFLHLSVSSHLKGMGAFP